MYASNFSFLLEDMFARAVPDKLANYIQISYHTVGNVKAGKSFTLTSTVTKGVWAVVGGGWCWCPIIKILSKLKEKGKRQENSDNWWESGWHWLGPCQRWANICQWQLLLKLQNYFAFFFNPPWKTGVLLDISMFVPVMTLACNQKCLIFVDLIFVMISSPRCVNSIIQLCAGVQLQVPLSSAAAPHPPRILQLSSLLPRFLVQPKILPPK